MVVHAMLQLADYDPTVLLPWSRTRIDPPSFRVPSSLLPFFSSPSPLPHTPLNMKRHALVFTVHARPLSQDRAKWPPHVGRRLEPGMTRAIRALSDDDPRRTPPFH